MSPLAAQDPAPRAQMSKEQILLLTSPTRPRFLDALNMQFVLEEVFVPGWWWWLLQELGSPACYCRAVQENGKMLDKLGLWLNGFSGDLGGFKQKKCN
ncbi:hypothetical protein TURU_054575 [Turdus rufiventris]|nr:hypothetical protein TURU_054575 [Turdus rufiventris]